MQKSKRLAFISLIFMAKLAGRWKEMLMTRTSKKLFSRLLMLCFLISLAACSVRVADLTLVSTKNIDLTDVKLDANKGSRYKGEDCKFMLFSLIPLGLPNIETAIDKALEAGHGNIMVDQVTEISAYWVVVGTMRCISAEGTVLNTQSK
jgi:hypothetical protein